MTKQETFKRRVRARMARTGERYSAARRVLLDQADKPTGRRWVAQPEMGDDAVRKATGRGWEEWCDVIDAWPGHGQGHQAVAAHLTGQYDIDGWWAQAVTVGWERITGRRLPHQAPDGTFTANKSRTITVDPGVLRAMLLDDGDREDLFGGLPTELRSRAKAKTLRIGMNPGVAQIAIADRGAGRTTVTIQHEKLPTYDDVVAWKAFWDEWLAAIDKE